MWPRPDSLSSVEFALNSSFHEAINSTPFRMNRISLLLNPFDVLLHNTRPTTEQASWLGHLSGVATYVKAHEDFLRARCCVNDAKACM
jgi:hypothetical protein